MYESRVKGIWYENDHLASISSNGDVTVWTVNIENQEITELCTTNIGCRPICLTMLNLAAFADEYILKREDSENETEESTIEKSKPKKNANSVKNVGKVVIEEDDDNEDETIVIRPKEKKQTNKARPNKKNTPTKTPESKTTPQSANKKRKSMDNTKSSAKKRSKLPKSQQAAVGFIEEDMD